jgi:hypothetical protein
MIFSHVKEKSKKEKLKKKGVPSNNKIERVEKS